MERILSITGEDPLDVHRKNVPTLTGVRMSVRFVLMSNELPNVRDVSGAFMTRVDLLRMIETFVGHEDRNLGDRLAAELPGILNWAIEGLQRLNQRGYINQPESANNWTTRNRSQAPSYHSWPTPDFQIDATIQRTESASPQLRLDWLCNR